MLTENDIDDILFAIDKAIGESYEPKHAKGWGEIEEKLLALKSAQQSANGCTRHAEQTYIGAFGLVLCSFCNKPAASNANC